MILSASGQTADLFCLRMIFLKMIEFMKVPITIYGFTFSIWTVCISCTTLFAIWEAIKHFLMLPSVSNGGVDYSRDIHNGKMVE